MSPILNRLQGWVHRQLLRREVASPPKTQIATSALVPLPAQHPGTDEWAVLTAPVLLSHINAGPRLNRLKELTHFGDGPWCKDCLPVIHALAEFVQMCPASEAHHHCHPSGLLQHILETCEYALRLRQGYMLPAGAPPEQQIRLQHRWTFAVFVCACLHDIAKPLTDLELAYTTADHNIKRWQPLAGSLVECGALSYRLTFKSGRDYQAHQNLALSLFQMLVPQSTRQWLLEDAAASDAIQKYLSNQDIGSPIAKIVMQADMTSVSQNLRYGSRTRFKTARAIPLVDRLMEALRRLLVEGVALPLNKSGGAGWVFEDSLWLVAKRVADEVRAYLVKNESPDAVPGSDKNDRLFDTWQEHGFCLSNPASGGAVWRVRVVGQNYSHELTVLRFPLHKVFADNNGSQPSPMLGQIVPIFEAEKVAPTEATPAVAPQTTIAVSAAPLPGTLTVPAQPASLPSPASATIAAASVNPPPLIASIRHVTKLLDAAGMAKPATAVASPVVAKTAEPDQITEEFLPESDSAAAAVVEIQRSNAESMARQVKAVHAKGAKPGVDRPVTVAADPLPGKGKTPDELAVAFMTWLQSELVSGAITYNQAGSMVHFSADEVGKTCMLLVTPAVYKRFAEAKPETCGEGGFAAAQKAIKHSGWAARITDSNQSFARFQVRRAEGVGGNSICATIITDPVRFINPLPPPNPRLVRVMTGSR
jgi:integrating conjugative element relaxase (TIGR03760 family)